MNNWIPDNSALAAFHRCSQCDRADFLTFRAQRVHEARTHGMKVSRPPTRSFGEHPQTPEATVQSTTRLLEWAAGYMEGEGCFSLRTPGPFRKPTLEVTAGSTDIEPLQVLQALFGGTLRERKRAANAVRPHMWSWAVYGSRALGVAQTLYPLLCPRRQTAIKGALVAIKAAYAH